MDSFSKLLASARKAPAGQDDFRRLTSPEEYLNTCQINLTKAYKRGGVMETVWCLLSPSVSQYSLSLRPTSSNNPWKCNKSDFIEGLSTRQLSLEVHAGKKLKPRLKPWYHRPWHGEIDARLATGDEINGSRICIRLWCLSLAKPLPWSSVNCCVVFVASPLPQTNFV